MRRERETANMPHFIQQLDERTLCTTLSGVLAAPDLDAVHEAAKALMAKQERISAMVILQDFRGFSAGVDWGNLAFYSEYGDRIVRMAIVGDPRWEADAIMFTGKGARRTEIEYFPVSEIAKAQAWLAAAPGATGA
jgi:hypothetical protein